MHKCQHNNGTSPLIHEMNQKLEGGITPLLTDVNQDVGSGTSPLLVHEMIQEHEGGTSPLLRGDGDSMTLYDTATNVVSIREDRGDCVVRRGWCQEHSRKARKITSQKQVWTRNKKTGLYSYRNRKLSVWSCTDSMPTLAVTMESRGSAGDNNGIRRQDST